jgi:hypothetical protein
MLYFQIFCYKIILLKNKNNKKLVATLNSWNKHHPLSSTQHSYLSLLYYIVFTNTVQNLFFPSMMIW